MGLESSPQIRHVTAPGKLFIFDTHPIQYRSPVFRELYARNPELKVFYFDTQFDGNRWWFHEVGKIPKQEWALPLRSGFPNSIVERRAPGIRGFIKELSELFQRDRPEAIVIYGYYLPEHWALWWMARYHRIPILFIGETMQRQAVNGVRSLIRLILQPLFFRGVRQFVSIGHQSHDFYRSFSVDEERITDGKYCVDTNFFKLNANQAADTRARLRAEYKIPAEALVLVFVGRLFDRKRPLDMLALHRNLAAHEKVHTLIIGNGPMEETLREQAKGDARIHLLGFKNQAETRDHYYAADVLVVPSEYETWGLVINEAFTAGIPAMVTETCGAARDLVVTGETGFVFPVGKVEVVTKFLQQALREPSLLTQLGKAARERVLGHYRVDQFSESILTALSVALGR